MIIDYSFWRPTAGQLANVNGVIRYLADDLAKTVSADELAFLHAGGIGTALVFENAADRAASGASAGTADGEFVIGRAQALDVPHGRPIYAAVDYDIPDFAASSTDPIAKLGPVGEYLRSFGAVLLKGGYELGVYGGYWLVSRVLDAGYARRAWQTAAWSGGQVDPRVCLYQPGVSVSDDNADLDLAGWRDWGQWRRNGSDTIVGADA
jgi:hypothetical protein